MNVRAKYFTGWAAAALAVLLLVGVAEGTNWSPGVGSIVREAEGALLAGRYDRAQIKLREAIGREKDPSNRIELDLKIARIYVFKGQVGRARFTLTKLARRTTDSRAWLEAAKAYLYYHPYRISLARRYLSQILRRNPKHVEALTESAFCDLNAGLLKKAGKTFKKVLNLNHRYIKAHYGLAKIQFMKKQYARAIDRLKIALQLGPENAETMYLLGSVYLGSKQPRSREAAMNWISRAADQEPKNIKYLAAGIFAALCRQHPADAEVFRKRIARIDPSNSYAIYTEGVYLELKGKVVQAFKKFEQALEKDWLNLFAHFSLGNMRTGYGNPEYVMNAELETWRYSRFKSAKKGIEHFENIVSSPEVFPFLHAVRQRLRTLYEEPGAPDWSNPGFVKKLKKMRDYGRLFNPY